MNEKTGGEFSEIFEKLTTRIYLRSLNRDLGRLFALYFLESHLKNTIFQVSLDIFGFYLAWQCKPTEETVAVPFAVKWVLVFRLLFRLCLAA